MENVTCTSPVLKRRGKIRRFKRKKKRSYFPHAPNVVKNVLCSSFTEFALPIDYFRFIRPVRNADKTVDDGSNGQSFTHKTDSAVCRDISNLLPSNNISQPFTQNKSQDIVNVISATPFIKPSSLLRRSKPTLKQISFDSFNNSIIPATPLLIKNVPSPKDSRKKEILTASVLPHASIENSHSVTEDVIEATPFLKPRMTALFHSGRNYKSKLIVDRVVEKLTACNSCLSEDVIAATPSIVSKSISLLKKEQTDNVLSTKYNQRTTEEEPVTSDMIVCTPQLAQKQRHLLHIAPASNKCGQDALNQDSTDKEDDDKMDYVTHSVQSVLLVENTELITSPLPSLKQITTNTSVQQPDDEIKKRPVAEPVSDDFGSKEKSGDSDHVMSVELDITVVNEVCDVSQVALLYVSNHWYCAVLISNQEVRVFRQEQFWSMIKSWQTITEIHDLYLLFDWQKDGEVSLLQINMNTADVYVSVVVHQDSPPKHIFLTEKIDVLTSVCTLQPKQFILTTTDVIKYAVNNSTIHKQMVLTAVSGDTVMSLSSVQNQSNLVIGSSMSCVYIWNHMNGSLLQCIRLADVNLSTILGSVYSSGVIVCHCILSTSQYTTRSCTLLTINPSNGQYHVLKTHKQSGIYKHFLLRVCTPVTNSIVFHDDATISSVLACIGITGKHVARETCSLLQYLPSNGKIF